MILMVDLSMLDTYASVGVWWQLAVEGMMKKPSFLTENTIQQVTPCILQTHQAIKLLSQTVVKVLYPVVRIQSNLGKK